MKKTTLFLLVIIVMTGIATSCNPISSHLTRAVILDGKPTASNGIWNYKINYINYKCVGYYILPIGYEVGDTIFVHDKYKDMNIK